MPAINDSISNILKFRSLNKEKFNKNIKNSQELIPKDTYSSNKISKNNNIPQKMPLEKSSQNSCQDKPKDWTVLLYLNGNCDLESDMIGDMNKVEKVGSSENINFIAQLAKASKGGEAKRIFLKKPGFLGFNKKSEVLKDLGKTNMANPQTLKDFITWGMKEYPAKHYMVLMSGHGFGFAGCMPDEIADDMMIIPEMETALKTVKEETGEKIDVLGIDACLMANAETAYALKDSVDFLAASEEIVYSKNWNYKKLAGEMKNQANTDGLTVREALEEIMKSQNNYAQKTSSVINCMKMPKFRDKMKIFSDKLLNTKASQLDIKKSFSNAQHFCTVKNISPEEPLYHMRDIRSVAMEITKNNNIVDNKLKEAALNVAEIIKSEVVAFENHPNGVDLDQSNGISAYTPTQEAKKYANYYDYEITSFAKDTGWGEVIKKYGD